MAKRIIIVAFWLLFSTEIAYAQIIEIPFRSVSQFPMPRNHKSGLTQPGFKIIPKVSKRNHSGKTWVVLKLDITFATAKNPNGGFSYRYLYQGKIYTDRMIGTEPFQNIKSGDIIFRLLVQGPNNFSKLITYDRIIGGKEICELPKNAKLTSYVVHIKELVNIHYGGNAQIINAIKKYEAAHKTKIVPRNPNNRRPINKPKDQEVNRVVYKPNKNDNHTEQNEPFGRARIKPIKPGCLPTDKKPVKR